MDVLILGNGFDIAHGLKTKYSDFLEYCAMQLNRPLAYKPSDVFFTNMWIRHFLNIQQQLGDTWIDLEKEIYEVIKHVSKLPIVNNLNCHKEYAMYYNDNTFSFYNIERYLVEPFGRIFPENGYVRIEPNNELQYKIYFSTPRGFVDFLYIQLREFTKLFEYYLENEVMSKINETPIYNLRINSECASLLNFNYTDTCEKLYKINFDYCPVGIKTKTVYIHGKINETEDCNLILGTQSFNNEQIPVKFNVFKKYNQRHKYNTIEKYQELLNELKYSKKIYTPTFHIVGHSLDETDHNILKHILLARENSIINIYYHDEESQEKLINNITEIISEEEVMAKVRFIHQHDPKQGIVIPQ